MKLYHGSNLEIEQIDLNKCRPFKDFGRGFYLTDIRQQAEKMAQRVARIYGGTPTVNTYEWDPDRLENTGLRIRRFEKPDQEWAMFVMNNRSRSIAVSELIDCNRNNQYDLVIGPVADDDLALLFRQFQSGLISVEILVREMKFKKLTSQYSFHTQRAMELLHKVETET